MHKSDPANSRPWHSLIWMGSGTALGQALSIVSTPLLTRIYSVEQYGVWALWVSLGVLFGSLGTLRYELAIVLAPDRRETNGLTVLACLLAAAATLVVFSASVLIPGNLALLIGIETTSPAIGLSPWLVLSIGFMQALQGWIAREGHFSALSTSNAALATITLIAQFTWGAIDPDRGLIFGTLSGYLAAIGVALVVVATRCEFHGWFSPRELARLAGKYRSYPCYMTPYSIVGILRERLSFFLLSRWGGAQWVGNFAFSQRLVNLPNSLVSTTLRPVVYQMASVHGPQAAEPLISQIQSLVVRLLLPCLVFFWFNSRELFELLFGERWGGAASLAVALSVPQVIFSLVNWMDRLFDVLGLQRSAFRLECAFTLLALGSFCVGYWVTLNLLYGVICQAATLILYHAYYGWFITSRCGYSRKAVFALALHGLLLLLKSVVVCLLLQLVDFKWRLAIALVLGLIYLAWVLRSALPGLKVIPCARNC